MNKKPHGPVEQQDRSQAIVAYLKGEMSDTEQDAFAQRIAEDETLQQAVEKAKEVLDALSASSNEPVIRLVNGLIVAAIKQGASDIHIVPGRGPLLSIQFRIDGILREVKAEEFTDDAFAGRLPFQFHQPMVDRIKTMTEMSLSERRLPQDGRVPIRHQDKNYSMRVTILPALYGERVTARLLPEQDLLLGLDQLGYTKEQVVALRRLSRARSGLVLVGGWAGSGRSTLMYSLLQEIQAPGLPLRNVMTVEDPVELSLSSEATPITQTAIDVRAGLTFPTVLHVLLRHNPDVLYCSSIRDRETAEKCVDIAFLGTLLLGALPVSGALAIVERLRNMGIPNYLIADSLSGLMGVRLARRIDTRRTEEYTPDEEELSRAGFTQSDGPFIRGVPTAENGNTGFSGRIPLLEIIEVTPDLRRKIAEGMDVATLARLAFPNGGTLRDNARAKIKLGLTTVEEVNWVLFDYEG